MHALGEHHHFPFAHHSVFAQTQWRILAASSVSLALHFALWVWSLEHTSLVHALLFVSSTPLFIAIGTWATRRPISFGEQAGALLGLAGGAVLARGADDDGQTVLGDLASVAACLSVIVYLYCGRHLRAWMPIFVYATIVTGCAALLLTALAMVARERASLVGWVAVPRYAWRVVYLAVGPGIVGHTGTGRC